MPRDFQREEAQLIVLSHVVVLVALAVLAVVVWIETDDHLERMAIVLTVLSATTLLWVVGQSCIDVVKFWTTHAT